MENWESKLLNALSTSYKKATPVSERAQNHLGRAGEINNLNLRQQRAHAEGQIWRWGFEQNFPCLEIETGKHSNAEVKGKYWRMDL